MQRWGPGGPYAAPCPAVHGDAAMPRGGRDRPPYIAAENGQRPVNGSRLQRPTAGRCKHRPLRRGRVAAGRMRRPGRALPPCFAGCAAAGRAWQSGRVFAGQGAAPLRRLRRHLPLQGRLLGAAAQKGSPARGAGCAGRRRLRGALPVGVGTIWQGLAEPCPMFLRGRCSHLPRKPCGGPLFPVLPPVCLIL